jgi:hypothetical protein
VSQAFVCNNSIDGSEQAERSRIRGGAGGSRKEVVAEKIVGKKKKDGQFD